MPRVSNDSGGAAGVLRIPGVYARLLGRERERASKGDPRPRRIYAGGPDDGIALAAPGHSRTQSASRVLHRLVAGEPVELPRWALGGATVPDERVRRLKREDRSITGWLVRPDDTVTPLRHV